MFKGTASDVSDSQHDMMLSHCDHADICQVTNYLDKASQFIIELKPISPVAKHLFKEIRSHSVTWHDVADDKVSINQDQNTPIREIVPEIIHNYQTSAADI